MIDYAKERNIPIKQSKEEPWSSDENMMHRSYEAGMLENPKAIPFERMFWMTTSPQKAPDSETILEIKFKNGNPVSVRKVESWILNKKGLPKNIEYGEEYTDPVKLFMYLNKVAGENGIGRIDIVESRYVGMKSRGVYETPAATVLHFAHQDLEGITLDREIIRRNQHISINLAERIYSGFWFSPEREAMQRAIDDTQKDVNGYVRVGLYKGNILAKGRRSSDTLYDEGISSMHKKGRYDQTNAKGFIDITALRLEINARRHGIR
jgi:argininosuccinate synthase